MNVFSRSHNHAGRVGAAPSSTCAALSSNLSLASRILPVLAPTVSLLIAGASGCAGSKKRPPSGTSASLVFAGLTSTTPLLNGRRNEPCCGTL